VAKKKQRGKPFTGADDPRRHRNTVAAGPVEPAGPQGDDLLAAMVYVSRTPKKSGESQLVRDCRAWKAKDLKGFMTRRAELERAVAASTVPGGDSEKDQGAELVQETIRRLLEKAGEGLQETPVAGGRCVTCGQPVVTEAE
jgi:hypothetical protein